VAQVDVMTTWQGIVDHQGWLQLWVVLAIVNFVFDTTLVYEVGLSGAGRRHDDVAGNDFT